VNNELPNQNLYSITEASRILGVSPTTLRRWEEEGRLTPARTPGGDRRFSPEDIQTILQSFRKETDQRLNTEVETLPPLPSKSEPASPPAPPLIPIRQIENYQSRRRNPYRNLAFALIFLLVGYFLFSSLPPLTKLRLERALSPGPVNPIVDVNDIAEYQIKETGEFRLGLKFPLDLKAIFTKSLNVAEDAILNAAHFLGTVFFGTTRDYYVTSLGEAAFDQVTSNSGQVTSLEVTNLTVTGESTGIGGGVSSWTDLTSKPPILSSLNSVTNNEGNIDLLAGSNITITPDDGANTITIAAGGGEGGDADTLDTLDSAQFLRSDTSDSFTSGTLTFNAGTILDVFSATLTLAANQIDESRIAGEIESVGAGTGLTGGGMSGSVTLSHADTSSQSSVDGSNGVVVQDITLDGFGHATALGTVDLDGRYYTETETDTLLAAQDALAEMEDVTITLAEAGDYLRYSGTDWVDVGISQILTDLKTVDGTGSGLDADLLDGQTGSYYLDRANHTGTQTASTISDFDEASQDSVGGIMTDTASVDFTYNDGLGQIMADVIPGGVDHGSLAGLGDDDHPQYLLASGARALTGNWDAGSFEIRAQTFQSDVATGTAPLIVASTTLVTNLNADLLDDQEGSYYLDLDNEVGTCSDCLGSTEIGGLGTGDITPSIVSSLDGVANDGGDIDLIAGANITITPNDLANTITFDVAGGTGSGLDADTLDGLDSLQFLRSDVGDSYTGIGTLTFDATTTLDVNGNIAVADTDIAFDGASTNLNLTGNLTINTNDLAVEKSTGRIGIGTATPAAFGVMTIDGGVRLRDAAATRYRSDWSVAAGGLNINAFDDTGGAYLPVRIDGLSFAMRADASDAKSLTLDNSGNVGVGTATPNARFHVNPTVTATADFTSLRSGIAYNGATPMSSWYGGYISAPTGTGTITNKYALVTEANAGNVGIGTVSPGQLLDVEGSRAAYITSIENTDAAAGQGLYINSAWTGGGSALEVQSGSTSRFRVNNSGTINIFGSTYIGGAAASANAIIEMGQNGATGNRYAYIDMVGDDTYTDYGLRLIRLNTGANTTSQIAHRGTGYLELTTQDAGSDIILTPADSVGIGITGPGAKLDVVGDIKLGVAGAARWRLFNVNDMATANNCDTATAGAVSSLCVDSTDDAGTSEMRLQVNGNLTLAGTSSPSGDPDIAEQIPVDDPSIEPGDILIATNPNQIINSRIYDNVLATKSAQPYQSAIVGIVSTNPTILIGEENAMLLDDSNRVVNGNRRAITLAGRVPVKVSTINGPIHAGDLLTTSSIPGVAMKATEAGSVVATALQDYTETGPYSVGKIIALLRISWYDPGVLVDSGGDVAQANPDGSTTKIASPTIEAEEGTFEKITATVLATLKKLVAQTVEAETGVFEKISVTVEAVISTLRVEVAKIATAFIEKLTVESLAVKGESIGQAIIPSGETELSVDYPDLTESSKVFFTLDRAVAAGVEKTVGTGFKFILASPSDLPVTIDYWIVEQ
jgi:excisionase family DNA binding protein